jgi:hypothetical protein
MTTSSKMENINDPFVYKINVEAYDNGLVHVPIGQASRGYQNLCNHIKKGEVALKAICAQAENLSKIIDDDPGKWKRANINIDVSSITNQLTGFISEKKEYYKSRCFGSIRQFFSERCGSIALMNRLITQIQIAYNSDYNEPISPDAPKYTSIPMP